jgi:hypothetical protein
MTLFVRTHNLTLESRFVPGLRSLRPTSNLVLPVLGFWLAVGMHLVHPLLHKKNAHPASVVSMPHGQVELCHHGKRHNVSGHALAHFRNGTFASTKIAAAEHAMP